VKSAITGKAATDAASEIPRSSTQKGMPVIVPDTNVMQIIGGHPDWVDESANRDEDPRFLRLPAWYREEIRALSAINLAIPRCHSTAWAPPASVTQELAQGGDAASDSLYGWGGEVADWAERWFWLELKPEEERLIRVDWATAQQLDLRFLHHAVDQAIARVAYALKSWHSRVLTCDRKSFWHHRHQLEEMGIAVRMPTELWEEMGPCL